MTAHMGATQVTGQAGERGPAFSWDESLEVLSNQRRRFVLHYLKYSQDAVDLHALAKRVASWETEKNEADVTREEMKRVQNALEQHHLPKMEELGFIEIDRDRRRVTLTDDASQHQFVVDILPHRGITWGEYYLGMVLISGIGLIGVVYGVPPFAWTTAFHWGVFVVTAFAISAAVHVYDERFRMRIGARDRPQEIDIS